VLTERLVPEGDLYLARAGRLRIDIDDTNHDSFKVDIIDLFNELIQVTINADVLARGDI
jgi:hypothetical protein